MSDQIVEFSLKKDDFPQFLQDLKAIAGDHHIVIAREQGPSLLRLKVMGAFKELPPGLQQYPVSAEQVQVAVPPSGSAESALDF